MVMKVNLLPDFLDKELKKVEESVSAEFKRVFAQELETLYRQFDDDRRVQSAAGAAKRDAMLRLVSSTLGNIVEKSLPRIFQTNIQQAVSYTGYTPPSAITESSPSAPPIYYLMSLLLLGIVVRTSCDGSLKGHRNVVDNNQIRKGASLLVHDRHSGGHRETSPSSYPVAT
ncbi:MAG: hypothetical protein Q9226_001367 [Calogaya cf. arnoldii]